MADAVRTQSAPPAASKARGPRSGAVSAATASAPSPDAEVARILGISVPVAVTLAQRPMTIGSVLAITVGTILEFEVPADSELTLYVGNQPIGRGSPVKIGENFGIRLNKIGTIRDRIGAMSPHDTPAPSLSAKE